MERKGKSMSNRKLKGIHRLKACSHFHDFLTLKASCLEACYRSDTYLGLHLLSLKAFLYVKHAEVVLSNLSTRSPCGFKNNYFDNKNFNSIRLQNCFTKSFTTAMSRTSILAERDSVPDP